MGISADAEKALRDLLSSDILSIDQSPITKTQDCEPELINDLNFLQVYLEGKSPDSSKGLGNHYF